MAWVGNAGAPSVPQMEQAVASRMRTGGRDGNRLGGPRRTAQFDPRSRALLRKAVKRIAKGKQVTVQ